MATKPFYIHQKPPAQSFMRLPNFLFEAPSFCSLSSEAKLLYAMILRRTDLSRKNGWADDYGKIYLYYTINEVCELLHCGRQKAVDTLICTPFTGHPVEGVHISTLALWFCVDITATPYGKAAFEKVGVRVMPIWWRRGESNPIIDS